MVSTRIIQAKKHFPRAWEATPFWQKELAKRPQRSSTYAELDLPDDFFDDLPENLRIPTTRRAINAMKWEIRKNLADRRCETIRSELWHRRLINSRKD